MLYPATMSLRGWCWVGMVVFAACESRAPMDVGPRVVPAPTVTPIVIEEQPSAPRDHAGPESAHERRATVVTAPAPSVEPKGATPAPAPTSTIQRIGHLNTERAKTPNPPQAAGYPALRLAPTPTTDLSTSEAHIRALQGKPARPTP